MENTLNYLEEKLEELKQQETEERNKYYKITNDMKQKYGMSDFDVMQQLKHKLHGLDIPHEKTLAQLTKILLEYEYARKEFGIIIGLIEEKRKEICKQYMSLVKPIYLLHINDS